jgi:hypothetical protein
MGKRELLPESRLEFTDLRSHENHAVFQDRVESADVFAPQLRIGDTEILEADPIRGLGPSMVVARHSHMV